MKNLFFLFLTLMFGSCGKSDSGTSTYSSRLEMSYRIERDRIRIPTIKNSSSGRVWNDSYTHSIIDEILKDENINILDKNIKSGDLQKLNCENFNNMTAEEKISFYVVYLSSIAEAESDFNNSSKSWAPDKTLNVGLFQIDKKSALRHGGITYKNISNDELENGDTNSRIAVNILRNQLRDRKNSLLPRYYWEVLYGEIGFKNFIRHFKEHLDELNCRSL